MRRFLFQLPLSFVSINSAFLTPSLHHPVRANAQLRPRSATPSLKMGLIPFNEAFNPLQQLANTGLLAKCAQLQMAGEAVFASLLLIAVLQGATITHQYATNPAGELIIPPGLTTGVEDATKTSSLHGRNIPVASQVMEIMNEKVMSSGRISSVSSLCTKQRWYNVNQSLVFLLPWLASQGSLALMRYGHLMHIGAIMGVAKAYDFFQKLPDLEEKSALQECWLDGEQPNIVVIGDSMAVGIGCLDIFDTDKNSGIIQKNEQLELSPKEVARATPGPGPIFPQTLAHTLSRRIGKPVKWRSGGEQELCVESSLFCCKERSHYLNPCLSFCRCRWRG
jgi:hypothetical protein